MKVVVVGGHLSPALAVIDSLPKNSNVVFIGRKHALEGDRAVSLEYQEITARGIPFLALTTARFQRTLTRHTIPGLTKFPYGLYQALSFLRKEKPAVVLAFGGYLSVPVGLAARILGIPLVIHEQTLEAGMANKFLAPMATKICISWKQSESYFPKEKVVLTGNPIRKFLPRSGISLRKTISDFQFPISKNSTLPLIYITGGSAGSHAINELVLGILPELLKKFRVIHQTGDAKSFNDFEKLSRKRESLPKELQDHYVVTKFVSANEVGSILTNADLVVSRSGMNTITELMHFGVPALLIPLPHGQRQEQLKNAKFLQSLGSAEILLQKDANSEVLQALIKKMLSEQKEYKRHASAAKMELNPSAAEDIINLLSYVAQKKSS